MNNGDRRPRRNDRRSEEGPSISDAIARLGAHGEELAEALAWCHENGMEGFARFYQEEIWYRFERLPRKRRPRPERREEDQESR